ncbi:MAG: integrase, partial [Gammaproteobacteria bacterium]|nr:integrase [Gammaproteobacteria bacterium]
LVFPSATGRTPSQASLPKLLHKVGIDAVPHGFRSSFRDWAAECTEAPREVCELALAHVNNDRVEAAYRRSDLFERRRTLMQQWADYLAATA